MLLLSLFFVKKITVYHLIYSKNTIHEEKDDKGSMLWVKNINTVTYFI
jgi:hypothetical protein